MFDSTGQRYCLADGETLELVSDRLPLQTELYAIDDVYGKAKTVQIVDQCNGEQRNDELGAYLLLMKYEMFM